MFLLMDGTLSAHWRLGDTGRGFFSGPAAQAVTVIVLTCEAAEGLQGIPAQISPSRSDSLHVDVTALVERGGLCLNSKPLFSTMQGSSYNGRAPAQVRTVGLNNGDSITVEGRSDGVQVCRQVRIFLLEKRVV